MKRMFFLPIFSLLICTATVSSAQNTDFQSGKIVSVETIDSSASKGGTDAPTPPNLQKHDVSIELGGTIYVCRAETPKDFDLSWAQELLYWCPRPLSDTFDSGGQSKCVSK
jgi:hypothetical protein